MSFFSETFDTVSTPTLPAGWTTTATAGTTAWVTSTVNPISPPNCAFAPATSVAGTTSITSPVINIPPAGAVLAFQNFYELNLVAPGPNSNVYSIIPLTGGKILVGGRFEVISSVTGKTVAKNLVKFNSDGSLDSTFVFPEPNDLVYTLVLDTDNNINVGGLFTNICSTSRNYLAKLDSNGNLISAFNPSVDNQVFSILNDSNPNFIIIGGSFSVINSVAQPYLARLDRTTGALDISFSPVLNATIGINCLAIDSTGLIYIGGNFNSVNSTTRNGLARLNNDGTLDAVWNPSPTSGTVLQCVRIATTGNILVAGSFTTIGGQNRTYLARLSPTGTGLADSWNPNPSSAPFVVEEELATGNILIGGTFTTVASVTRRYVAMIDPVTGSPTTWIPFPGASPGFFPGTRSIAFEINKILIGGNWFFVDNTVRVSLARVNNTTGAIDLTFVPGIGFRANDASVLQISINSGPFVNINNSGATFITGAYQSVIASSTSPLFGENGWSGFSRVETGQVNNYVLTQLNLPSSANGLPIQLRWMVVTNTGTSSVGSRIDNVELFAVLCMHPEMSVMTVDNVIKKIRDVVKGDKLMTQDFETPATVVKNHRNTIKHKSLIKIQAGSLGNNLPTADIMVTSGHKLMLDGKPIKAGHLINNKTIKRVRCPEYTHPNN
jgi:hypothetical protein